MSIKPWREIAKPHHDVLEGSFKQSEFAADISQVAAGTATHEYQDAESFFSRTFITEGMRLLLISVAKRLEGLGGDPVIQLQTAFGGGKTHTMLAVYHLASRKTSTDKLMGIPPILDDAGIQQLPQAKVAVIDGIKLSPNQPQHHGSIQANTLWGELAWQLLGAEGYQMVADSDASGTSPGKEVLRQILEKAGPSVILIDELVAFMRQLGTRNKLVAGTFDSNLSFIQALTEAIKLVPYAVLLASLPESDLEAGGTTGQRALTALEKYFARVEAIWKPVGSTESFEIVRRRLFESPGSRDEIEASCRQFLNIYTTNQNKFPSETQSNDYFERLCQSYPIHPEIFDRLYEDWSTLEKFQRTRGVLQYMAVIIHRLWNSDNRDAMITPGSITLDDMTVRTKSIHYLPQGWEPVIEKEVDGTRSTPYKIDSVDTRFGGFQAARRVMRTVFLGSAPSINQNIRGIQLDRILLGCIQPGQNIGVFEDVLKRLRDRLHYMYSDKNRYWLDTRPNLRREMESRKRNFKNDEHLYPLLKERINKIFGRQPLFSGIHTFTPSVDIPDDIGQGPRLVILPLDDTYSRGDVTPAVNAAEEILRNRGKHPRQKQNRLIFIAPDLDSGTRLKEMGRVYLAWQSIVNDVDRGSLDLTMSLSKQARQNLETVEQSMQQLIRETIKWLLCPYEEMGKGRPVLKWEVVTLSPGASNIAKEIETKLHEEEWLITDWNPIHLKNLLEKWYFKDDVSNISVQRVWHDSCNYLYFPRIVNEGIYKQTIVDGIASTDFFGYASGKEMDKYLGFIFGKPAHVVIDQESLLIHQSPAADYKAKIEKPIIQPQPTDEGDDGTDFVAQPPFSPTPPPVTPTVPSKAKKKRFYGTINLNPIKAKLDFAQIMDEVVQHFTLQADVNVTIHIDIEANTNKAFDETIQRTISENCKTLNFNRSEFEDE